MKPFVSESSVVREIWGKEDVVLFIFAGAAAEFALNRQVDWLYYTGKLPADPIGRLFSTVGYARRIIFSEIPAAVHAVDSISHIHSAVETKRGRHIPAEAYKDVLYMLIHYSVASFELLERKLADDEKTEILRVFGSVGERMHISNLASDYAEWTEEYQQMLQNDLVYSCYTKDLFRQYRKHLGLFRYKIMMEVQRMLVPAHVNKLLGLGKTGPGRIMLLLYKRVRKLSFFIWLMNALIPKSSKSPRSQSVAITIHS